MGLLHAAELACESVVAVSLLVTLDDDDGVGDADDVVVDACAELVGIRDAATLIANEALRVHSVRRLQNLANAVLLPDILLLSLLGVPAPVVTEHILLGAGAERFAAAWLRTRDAFDPFVNRADVSPQLALCAELHIAPWTHCVLDSFVHRSHVSRHMLS